MSTTVRLLFVLLFHYLNSSEALECHNCLSFPGDTNCQQVSIERLGEKLRQNERKGEESPLTVSRHADACLIHVTELGDNNGNRLLTVVRTQIRTSESGGIFIEEELDGDCQLKTVAARIELGVKITTKYCACKTDYCNGQSKLLSSGFLKSFILVIFILFLNYVR